MNDPMSKPVTVTLSLREWEWLEKLIEEFGDGAAIQCDPSEGGCGGVHEITAPIDHAVNHTQTVASISRQLEGNRR